MDSISANLASLVHQSNQSMMPMISFQPNAANSKIYENMNDVAAFVPSMLSGGTGFDSLMNNVAAFRDILSVAQSSLFSMREKGEGIRDLLAQAREEGPDPIQATLNPVSALGVGAFKRPCLRAVSAVYLSKSPIETGPNFSFNTQAP